MNRDPTLRKAGVAVLFLFAVLSLILTYPLVLHLTDAVEDRQDALLNVWITAWDGRQLLTDPLHLFEANIFYPYPQTLAYSELLLGNGLLALPLTAASGNPVLGYNVALLLSFVLSALGAYLLVVELTRSPGAGLVAGAVFAFCAYRMTNLAQAQLLTTQWLPFALLALHQLMHRPRLRHVATFVLFFWLQALSSFYYAFLLALAVLGFVAWVGLSLVLSRRAQAEPCPAAEGQAAARVPLVAYLALAAACCILLILPFALPYFQVQQSLGFERSLADNEPFSASLRQFLMVPPRSVLHAGWLPSDETPIAGGYPVDALFPGLMALALGFVGLIWGRGQVRWFFFLLLAVAFTLSLGPRLYLAPGRPAGLDVGLPYAWLYAIVPGFKALRAPVRFDALIMLALAVLAGYGVASLRVKRTAVLFAGLVVLESLVWPAAQAEPVPVGQAVPPVYRWLAHQPAAPILELPMAFTPGGPQLEYQYLSTYHWHPTPDGYSGFIPPKHGQIVYEMERFPGERSASLLQALGVRYVILHADRFPTGKWTEVERALSQSPELSRVESFGADEVYELLARDLDPSLLQLQVYLPPRAAVGRPYTAYLLAVNNQARSHALRPTDRIQPTITWQGGGGHTTSRVAADPPLVISPDGGIAVVLVLLTAPPDPGDYQVTLFEEEGPLGRWSGQGTVQVGDEEDNAFPVAARLVAVSVPPVARPGQSLPVRLTWRALGKIDAYYSTYVKLRGVAGNTIVGWDGEPQAGRAPTLLWVPGEEIEDEVTLTLPSDLPPGLYTVEVGMYRAQDLATCLLFNATGELVDRVIAGPIRIDP
jgi:hypothetical protein